MPWIIETWIIVVMKLGRRFPVVRQLWVLPREWHITFGYPMYFQINLYQLNLKVWDNLWGQKEKLKKLWEMVKKDFLRKKFPLRNTFMDILHGNMISKVDQFALLGFGWKIWWLYRGCLKIYARVNDEWYSLIIWKGTERYQ